MTREQAGYYRDYAGAPVDHLARIWAAELGDTGVRIFSVDPGEMDTETAGPYTLPETAAWPTADEIYAAWPRMARANGRS